MVTLMCHDVVVNVYNYAQSNAGHDISQTYLLQRPPECFAGFGASSPLWAALSCIQPEDNTHLNVNIYVVNVAARLQWAVPMKIRA